MNTAFLFTESRGVHRIGERIREGDSHEPTELHARLPDRPVGLSPKVSPLVLAMIFLVLCAALLDAPGLATAQPTVDGDLSDAEYVTITTRENGNDGLNKPGRRPSPRVLRGRREQESVRRPHRATPHVAPQRHRPVTEFSGPLRGRNSHHGKPDHSPSAA